MSSCRRGRAAQDHSNRGRIAGPAAYRPRGRATRRSRAAARSHPVGERRMDARRPGRGRPRRGLAAPERARAGAPTLTRCRRQPAGPGAAGHGRPLSVRVPGAGGGGKGAVTAAGAGEALRGPSARPRPGRDEQPRHRAPPARSAPRVGPPRWRLPPSVAPHPRSLVAPPAIEPAPPPASRGRAVGYRSLVSAPPSRATHPKPGGVRAGLTTRLSRIGGQRPALARPRAPSGGCRPAGRPPSHRGRGR